MSALPGEGGRANCEFVSDGASYKLRHNGNTTNREHRGIARSKAFYGFQRKRAKIYLYGEINFKNGKRKKKGTDARSPRSTEIKPNE